ncbi:putative transcriptional regulator [Priestia megaterium]|nr:helix-turn-helix transcriptional regulator [Priestia megaterium]RFB19555.1 transcriptional regulator [Bacillus sp. ALD]MCM3155398.1 helix-turn-helix transcriptional regulator [Priestia megaterium]PFQ77219.1 transcriptional regulator [Priestia megaterium]PFW45421.1 transcriptional regulator [Priestia megaterium]TJZ31445.1 transcriptional regulator [Priestia megaterium]
MKIVTTNNVKKYRETAGLTQAELAERVGTKRITIASLEREKYEPSVGLAMRLAKTFNCTVEDIFTEVKKE